MERECQVEKLKIIEKSEINALNAYNKQYSLNKSNLEKKANSMCIK